MAIAYVAVHIAYVVEVRESAKHSVLQDRITICIEEDERM